MLYALLRVATGIALRWFYRDVSVRHRDRISPDEIALLLVVNHPNALIDALLVGWMLPRRLTITAKATLFENPVLARFLRYMGVVPLRRASDEHRLITAGADRSNQLPNTEAFRAILERLEEGGAVLIFPEGKSHDEPTLAPLRTGPARIALQAHRERRVRSLAILPIGLVFERKEALRSRVLIDVGEPLDVSRWVTDATDGSATADISSVSALTEEIDRRLRDVTLNYATTDEAVHTRSLATVFASLLDDPPTVSAGRSLKGEVELERHVAQARRLLESEHTDPALRARAECLLDRLGTFERTLHTEHIGADDIAISVQRRHGARFALREGGLLGVVGPVALWGRLNHWIPFRLARVFGERDMTSRDQPAMRTILAGFVLVLLFYGLATTFVMWAAGGVVAMAYLLSLPIAADIDLHFTERMRRARQRMRTYLRFRSNPELRERLSTEHTWLTGEIVELAHALEAIEGAQPRARSEKPSLGAG